MDGGSADRFFGSAKELVDDVILGRKVVVVSYVVILETIHTLRRRITENYKSERSQDGTPRHIQIRNEIDKITDMFLSLVYDLARKGHILLIEPSVSITDHHVLVLRKMKQYFGRIRTGSPSRTPEYRYMGLGHADLEHAFLAKLCNVGTFYSSDLSFEHLDNDDDFKDMRFEIIR